MLLTVIISSTFSFSVADCESEMGFRPAATESIWDSGFKGGTQKIDKGLKHFPRFLLVLG